MDGVDDTKRLKGRLDDTIGYFELQITNRNGANGLVSDGDWYRDVDEEERGALEEPSRRSFRDSLVLQVTRTLPFLMNWTADTLSASKARNNCGVTSDIPVVLWISAGKCNTTILGNAIV